MKIVTLALLLLPSLAHAYIDPGTGSYLLQLLLAGGLGALYTIKTYWSSIKAYFSSFGRKKDK